jgi:hypothetical protein
MAKKTNSKLTKIKRRFGAFEVRISDVKVEVEDYTRKQRKYVYGNQTIEYNAFLILLGEMKATEEGYVPKSSSEKKENDRIAEFLVYMLNATQLLFNDESVRGAFIEAVNNAIQKQTPPADDEETEEEILSNLKAEQEAKEILAKDEAVQSED